MILLWNDLEKAGFIRLERIFNRGFAIIVFILTYFHFDSTKTNLHCSFILFFFALFY